MSEPLQADPAHARFDPGAARTIELLSARLAAAPAVARRRLEERLRVHVERLRARFEARAAELSAEAMRLAEQGWDRQGRVAAALASGRLTDVARAARRHPGPLGPLRREAQARLVARLSATVQAREGVEEPGEARAEAVDPLVLAQRLYRDTVADAVTAREAQRATTPPPADVGPYHGPTVARRALAAMDALHRPYLRAQLGRLDVYTTLEALAVDFAPPPAPKTKAKRKRPAKK